MSALKTTLMILAGLLAGLAIATWLPGGGTDDTGAASSGPMPPGRAAPPLPAAGGARTDAELAARLARVEAALLDELAERAALEARVEELADRISATAPARASAAGSVPAEPAAAAESRPARRNFRGPDSDAPLADRLVAGGFSIDRAQWIERRMAELPMEVLRAQYEARRDGTPLAPERVDFDGTLRAELGDAEYERYLQALGRPTAVNVGGVLASSPAEQAGLRAGDQIVAYGGARVFDNRDLNRLTLQGTPGEPVLVDVLRDGQRIQVVLPRGPVGITGRGRFRRP